MREDVEIRLEKIQVLDKGYVRLVSHMGGDLAVVRAARVSYDADWRTGDDEGKDEKLLRYMYKHKHMSPFEHVTFTFEVKAPISIFREWHRHRTQSYNELSARYMELAPEFYLPSVENIGVPDKANKQARVRGSSMDMAAEDLETRMHWLREYNEHTNKGFEIYKRSISNGIPREVARQILQVSTYSRMFATMNMRNLFQFLELRDHPDAMWEIQEYARACKELIQPIVPICYAVFEESKAQ